ncbi:MAG: two-component system response regulator [Gammaproteobacteria bacterium CG_4_10_14_0_8_um_filter_38_16]|nr:MAG: two-component system response regulator [Gammaproteobacteria bacterium CG_4_10_14_0_8_um_filter_38_16]PJA02887.1 MAG: two-component system response regulator [Gammaproteobacteria bacterium CG_4_10_14_0_2_um_filter_38_22]PJB10949.1 MAG: two-component system response regulator [Gammaproteobacteria bacterium CG_4_9_14_3_um_filter_38_9]
MRLTVLVIEDNALNRDLFSRVLMHQGYNVMAAANGVDGIVMAKQNPPDVILLDMRLPDMSGCAVVKKIKKQVTMRHIPIIALSAYATVPECEKMIAIGCDAVEMKPIAFTQLIQRIEKYRNKKIKK